MAASSELSSGSKERFKKNSSKSKHGTKHQVSWPRKKKAQPEQVIIEQLTALRKVIDPKKIKTFRDLPLSQHTQKGLKDNGFVEPTEIQRESLRFSLNGHDVLGAAKTGSGKTLAFLIPILEVLYSKQWTRLDGTGALVITPTRELAYQIFETLRKVGSQHEFSAGLIIGGKDLKFERTRMDNCNIIICTPGRLLQHMDENPLFDCVNLQVLVLDEADRILDLGFQQTMNSIIANLPTTRQTLLFSATQTKSVRDLARLSLKDAMYVSVHEHAKYSTPESLAQSYMVCELEDKLAVLYSFIRNHLKHKVIVFMSSCKQVKYVYESFCHLRPGVSLMALYGSLHQMRRMAIYEDFCKKSKVVLFATDIAARGLDFPAVNWVVQLDCPEDADTYIHRAGRTARLEKSGESFLVLLPSEKEAMLKRLEERKIPIKEISINPDKLQYPTRKLEAFLARYPQLKETAQRAFVSYIKSVFLMKDKEVFNVEALNTDAFARSMGLAVSPRIRFLARKKRQEMLQRPSVTVGDENGQENEDVSDDSDSFEKKSNSKQTRSQENNSFQKEQNGIPSSKGAFGVHDDDDSEDDILKVKRRNHELVDEIAPLTEEELKRPESKKKSQPVTKAAVAKKLLKKNIKVNKTVVFDDNGEAILDPKSQKLSSIAHEYDAEDVGGVDIEKAKQVMQEEDRFDKERFREKIRLKHREEKKKMKEKKENQEKVDDFGSDSEEDDGPDLSWLPDPDKIYGKEKSNEHEESDTEEDSIIPYSKEESSDDEKSESEESSLSENGSDNQENSSSNDEAGFGRHESSNEISRSKRKIPFHQKIEKKRRRRQNLKDGFSSCDTGLSLLEDEELALKLLQASKH